MDLGMPMCSMRFDQAEALDYEVIVHVDRVIDFTPLPASPSHQSFTSDTSGLPGDEADESEWPVSHPFMWRLGVPDDRHELERRAPVFERLGRRGRDRSPPRGGPSGGLQLFPFCGVHDFAGPLGGRPAGSGQGGGIRGGGGNHFRRRGATGWAGARDDGMLSKPVWRLKTLNQKRKGCGF